MVQPTGDIAPGAFVEIRDRENRAMGFGLYNPRSEIALRVIGSSAEPPDLRSLLDIRLREAIALRTEVLRLPERTDAWRVLHSEGDGASGLIVDRYASVLVVEPFSLGWVVHRDLVEAALRAAFPGETLSIVWRADRTAAAREGIQLPPESPASPVDIREGTLTFRIRPGEGHKTGFFLDQRDARAWVGARARGRRVLDAFCYSGGFALSACAGGASSAVGVDLDEEAMALARANARRNGLEATFVHADVFEYLRAPGDPFGLVVLDPSKQAKVREEIPRALRAYHDMAGLAARRIAPGGLLVAASCSGLVEEEAFGAAVREGVRAAGRRLQEIGASGAAPDHPVAGNCPESRYLKVLFARLLPV